MAQFKGTIKEFTKYIGAYTRLKIASIAAKYKMQKGKCEDCGTPNSLEAAHLKGKGRALIIATILSEFIEDDTITMDLKEFEQKFVDAHLPIESTIRILCNGCHRKYDKNTAKVNSTDQLISIADEGAVIASFVKNQMNKSKAMKMAHDRSLTSLSNSNTIFSNIIPAQDGWWLQPFNDKFKDELFIILNNNSSHELYILKLPANTITNPSSLFKQRNDKYRSNCSDIYISTSGILFREKNGFDFSKFLVEKIKYF